MSGLTDALDKTLAWAYDDVADETRTTTYTYDAAGALASATDGTSTITITNDRLRRPTSVTVSGDTGATTTYAYSFSAPTRTDAAGTTTMAVDPFGRLTSLTPPGFGAFTTTWGADGQPTVAAAPNGNSTAYGYDALGRLLTMTTGARAAYTYTVNRAGSRMSEASTISGDPGNGTATLGYDALGRLTSYALSGIRTLGAAWQEVPTRSSLVTDGTPVTQAFDAANRPSGSGYAADADGRMTARPGASGTALEWDSLGRLVRVRATPGGTILATYTYDALDRLLLADRGAAGRLRFRYAGTTAALTGIVDDATGTVLRHVVPAPDGTVLADRSGAGTDPRTYGTNAHHDVTWVADSTGAVIATARYDPWGTLLRSSGTLPAWRFQGSWHDPVTDLAYARARWYSSALGSFISEDTLLGAPETPASRHLLAYAEGDPINGWDPSGMYDVNAVLFGATRPKAGIWMTTYTVPAHSFEIKPTFVKIGTGSIGLTATVAPSNRHGPYPACKGRTLSYKVNYKLVAYTAGHVSFDVTLVFRYSSGQRIRVWLSRDGQNPLSGAETGSRFRVDLGNEWRRLNQIEIHTSTRFQPEGFEEPLAFSAFKVYARLPLPLRLVL